MLVAQFADASGQALGLSMEDVMNAVSGAASDVCKLAPAGQIVAGAAGAGSVQTALQTVNAICGNQPSATSTTNPQYPVNCVKRFNTTHATWTVYCPPGTKANFQGFRGSMLSDTAPVPVSPAIPPGTTVAMQADGVTPASNLTTEPTGATNGGTEKDMPWYKNWKYLVPIGLGVIGAGVGVHYYRKKKKG